MGSNADSAVFRYQTWGKNLIMTQEQKAKYEAYRNVYAYLHYDYEPKGKTKEQVIEDIKQYCLKQSKSL